MNELKKLSMLPLDIVIAALGIVSTIIASLNGALRALVVIMIKFRMKMVGVEIDEEEENKGHE